MLRLFQVDEVPLLQAEHPDPLDLGVMAGQVVLLHAGVHASPAADAAGKVEAVPPQRIRAAPLGADGECPSVLLAGSAPPASRSICFFSVVRHLEEVFLEELFPLFLAAGGKGKGGAGDAGYGKGAKEFSACQMFIGPFRLSIGLNGGGSGLMGLNFGSCGLWQFTQRKYVLLPPAK